MRIRVGTSGFAYKEWKVPSIPRSSGRRHARVLRRALRHGGDQQHLLPLPKPGCSRRAADTPEHFAFVLKAPQRITHIRKPRTASDVEYFLNSAESLGPKRGPDPVSASAVDERRISASLDRFTALLPEGTRAAFEFRHATWFDDETYALLKQRNATLAASETDEKKGELGPPVSAHHRPTSTAPYRLHGSGL